MTYRERLKTCGLAATAVALCLGWGTLVLPVGAEAADAGAGLAQGDRVDTVGLCELQEHLLHLGYYTSAVDGQYGPGTAAAIRSYEDASALPVAGAATRALLESLRASRAQARDGGEPAGQSGRGSPPRSGTRFHDFRAGGQAPLEIATASDGGHFYVKVQDVSNPASYRTIFIRGGGTIDTEVPLGTYTIKYAAGDTWYGPRCLFGVGTVFNKVEETFRFERHGNEISGYRIELILQRDGNLATSRIPRAQF